MSTPTLDPTDQQFLDELPLVDGGIFEGADELLRRLKVNVPGKTDVLNTALGLSGNELIPPPKSFGIAPGDLTDQYIDSVLIGAATTTTALAPGLYKNVTQLVIYSVGKRLEGPQQFADAHRRASVIRGVLRHFLDGCTAPNGRCGWSSLIPTGASFLPDAYNKYAGVACYYVMQQMPDDNNFSGLETT